MRIAAGHLKVNLAQSVEASRRDFDYLLPDILADRPLIGL